MTSSAVSFTIIADFLIGTFRGFGFITYEKAEDGKKVLGPIDQPKEHFILGKQVQLKQAFSKEYTRQKLLDEQKRKLFLEEIPKDMEKEEFQKYFKKYGELEEVRVIHKKRKNGTEKHFCFVMFKHQDDFNKVLAEKTTHIINGVSLECRQIKLREELKTIQIEAQKEKMIKEGKDPKAKKKKKRRRRKKKEKKSSKQSKKDKSKHHKGDQKDLNSDSKVFPSEVFGHNKRFILPPVKIPKDGKFHSDFVHEQTKLKNMARPSLNLFEDSPKNEKKLSQLIGTTRPSDKPYIPDQMPYPQMRDHGKSNIVFRQYVDPVVSNPYSQSLNSNYHQVQQIYLPVPTLLSEQYRNLRLSNIRPNFQQNPDQNMHGMAPFQSNNKTLSPRKGNDKRISNMSNDQTVQNEAFGIYREFPHETKSIQSRKSRISGLSLASGKMTVKSTPGFEHSSIQQLRSPSFKTKGDFEEKTQLKNINEVDEKLAESNASNPIQHNKQELPVDQGWVILGFKDDETISWKSKNSKSSSSKSGKSGSIAQQKSSVSQLNEIEEQNEFEENDREDRIWGAGREETLPTSEIDTDNLFERDNSSSSGEQGKEEEPIIDVIGEDFILEGENADAYVFGRSRSNRLDLESISRLEAENLLE